MFTPKLGQPFRFLTWDEIYEKLHLLAKHVEKKHITNVWGVPRNGQLITLLLSHMIKDLNLCQSPNSFKSETNHAVYPTIVDDIYDTGNTLSPYVSKGYETLCLFRRQHPGEPTGFWEKPKSPDFWVEEITDNSYLVFPWEEEALQQKD